MTALEWKKGMIDAANGKPVRDLWRLPLPGLEFGDERTLVFLIEGPDDLWNLFLGGKLAGKTKTADEGKRDAERRLAALAKDIAAFAARETGEAS